MSDLFSLDIEPEPEDPQVPVDAAVVQDGVQTGTVGVAAPQSLVTALETANAEIVYETSAVEVLPPDFKLPALTQFVPDLRLRRAADGLAATALAIDVTNEVGLKRADATLVQLRGSIKAIEADFEEPTGLAYRLHKRLTGMLGEWLTGPRTAADTVARRVVAETARLDGIAEAQRVKDQAEADARAKANAAQAATSAKASGAPPAVVEQLKQQAKTATAPPVAARTAAPLASTGTTKGWKARLAGTPADAAEPNPDVKDLTEPQRRAILRLCGAIAEGKAPIAVLKTLDWAYLNKRADSEKTELAASIPGLEAFEYVAPRAKPGARK